MSIHDEEGDENTCVRGHSKADSHKSDEDEGSCTVCDTCENFHKAELPPWTPPVPFECAIKAEHRAQYFEAYLEICDAFVGHKVTIYQADVRLKKLNEAFVDCDNDFKRRKVLRGEAVADYEYGWIASHC